MSTVISKLPKIIFVSRWLQAPLYLGLIIVLVVYIYQFAVDLFQLVINITKLHEYGMMLATLDLIDVVMIANLLIMVIIGGYKTFVSRAYMSGDPDQPEWLEEVSAGTIKIKLALALVSISSIHLLRTFIDPGQKENFVVMWQVIIHLTLVVSAIAVAFTDKLMNIEARSG